MKKENLAPTVIVLIGLVFFTIYTLKNNSYNSKIDTNNVNVSDTTDTTKTESSKLKNDSEILDTKKQATPDVPVVQKENNPIVNSELTVKDNIVSNTTDTSTANTKTVLPSGPKRYLPDGELNLIIYNPINILDYIKNPKVYFDKPIKLTGLVVNFNPGSNNYIQAVDLNDKSSVPQGVQLKLPDDSAYTLAANDLSVYDRVLIYGSGSNSVKFNVSGDNGYFDRYEPVIEVDAIYKCSIKSVCQYPYSGGVTKLFEKKL